MNKSFPTMVIILTSYVLNAVESHADTCITSLDVNVSVGCLDDKLTTLEEVVALKGAQDYVDNQNAIQDEVIQQIQDEQDAMQDELDTI